jgi:UDP-GlcNAc:undecaprenyl-phosphate/decaprenyl-phosphate GlcNAc-1-phosphate transferase
MIYYVMLAFACGGGLITWLTIPIIQRHCNFLNREEPSQFHHTHKSQRSRLGGLAMVVSFLVIAVAAGYFFPGDAAQAHTRWVIVGTTAAMFLLGFLDDIKPLGARKKLTGQILIALMAWCQGIHVENFKNPFDGTIYHLGSYGCALTVFWLIALPNLINLVDGMDGLAGGISLMLMGLLSYAGLAGYGPGSTAFPALCAAGMVGVIIGFLRYNFPPARIFMGDGGAYFLGFLVAELSVVNSHKGTIAAGLLAPLFVLALPIVDVSMAIVRRGLKGMPIFRPDRRHIHHKLLGIGYTPRRAVLTLYFVTMVFLAFGIVVFWSEGRWAPVLFGVGCLLFIVSARSFSFSREWFSVGRVLGNSMEMRETMHYALTLSRWLEMEASRCDSVENLWSDFKFLVIKLNFSRVRLSLPDGRKEWQREEAQFPPPQFRNFRLEFGGDNCMALELEMEAGADDARVFSNLCDITCEAWQNAAARWHAVNQIPVGFKARAASVSPDRNRKSNRPYVPLPPSQTPGIEQSL